MKTSDFDYVLPQELIAQSPAEQRDKCRMLCMERESGSLEDRIFSDIIDYLEPGDLLIANETRVLPARLLGKKHESGGEAEVFLLREVFNREPKTDKSALWEVLVRPGKRLKPPAKQGEKGALVDIPDASGNLAIQIEIVDWVENGQKGERIARLTTPLDSLDTALHAAGNTPLPPYIKNYVGDKELYQTVYSKREASAAAPTAGLHFTPELIEAIKAKGIQWKTVELEVGLDTFRIVEEENAEEHQIHTEYFTVSRETIEAIEATKAAGKRVIAVGTTSVRSIESAWDGKLHRLVPRDRETTSLYILPGYEFHVVDALITNFHVPKSTLMMLVSALSSRDNLLHAYEHAVQERYRFLSFGDAMFIH